MGGARGGGGGGGGGAHVHKATRDALLMIAKIFIYASLFGGNITGRRQIFGLSPPSQIPGTCDSQASSE